jgi:hypothetical protein
MLEVLEVFCYIVEMVISVILALHARSLNVPEFQEILIVLYR